MYLAAQLLVCVVLVVVVGSRLTRSADVLAEKTGLGRTWVGAVLLAGATSLPELATGVSAVAVFDAPDLAAGGVFGSCLFNLLILALLDVAAGPGPLFRRVQTSQVLGAGLSCVLLGVAAGGIMLADKGAALTVGWFGGASLLVVALYLLSARVIASFELRRRAEVLEREADVFQYHHIPAWRAYLTFALLSLAIIGLGLWLASLGDQVAEVTGLGESFVGSLLLAATTSLPELVASFEATRLDAADLAVSNIFGSNIFNMAALGIYDLAFLRGNLWASISQVHVFTAVAAMVMTSVAIVGLVYAAEKRPRVWVDWSALSLICLYVGGMYVIYRG